MMSQLDSSLSQLNWLINKSKREHDADEKPNLSYSQLIKLAIENSAEKRCTLSEIYAYITSNYPYYRAHANPSWKNSIRHNLSLNKQFVRENREIGDVGKGSYWRCVLPNENLKTRRYKTLESDGGEGPHLNPAIQKIFCTVQNSQIPPSTTAAAAAAAAAFTQQTMIVNQEEILPQQQQQQQQFQSPSTSCDDQDSEEYIYEQIPQQENASLTAATVATAATATTVTAASASVVNDDVSDINLFESLNLSSSFRDLYEQLFPASIKSNRQQQYAQIDLLKTSLETIGMDYQNDDELRNIDMQRFKKLVESGIAAEKTVEESPNQPMTVVTEKTAANHENFVVNGLCLYDANCSLNELNKDFSVVDSVPLQTPLWTADEEDSDDFDWDTLIDR